MKKSKSIDEIGRIRSTFQVSGLFTKEALLASFNALLVILNNTFL